MENEQIGIQDESNDHKYFTIIPNFIANHSTANDQALYFQMKKIAGEKGISFASEVYFREKLGIGTEALKKSIKYLLEHRWINYIGVKEVPTKGGLQNIKCYQINDIWNLNNNYYESLKINNKGYSETEPLSETPPKGILKTPKGYSETATNKIYNKDINKIEKKSFIEEFKEKYPNQVSDEEHKKSMESLQKVKEQLIDKKVLIKQ